MSKLLEVPRFLPNKGLVLNKPEEFLKNNYSVDGSINMEFYNELLQSRGGMSKANATQLSGPITLIDQFWLNTPSWYLMICTTKDIYKWNPATTGGAAYDILTPLYQTGTIYIHAGDPTIVHGTGTSWASQLKIGDYIKINTGNINAGATWYEIDTVDSNTQLTLKSSAVACTNSPYAARKCFEGEATDFWNAVTFDDDNLGKVWIATNGVDTPIIYDYDVSTQVRPLTGLPLDFDTAKYINVYKDRVFFWWCVVDGSNLPMSGYWSAVANCEDWDDLDYMDLLEDNYWITGVANFADYQIVFRERDAQIIRYVGGDYVFDPEKSSTCGGCWAAQSIIETASYIYYYGPDNKFKRWNILREEDVFGDELLPFMKNLDPNTEQYIFGWEVEPRNQLRWMIPFGDTDYHNYILVYDYAENVSYLWKIEKDQSLWSIGEYINTLDLYLDDPVWGEFYLDETEGFFDDRTFLSGTPTIVYGGYDGYVRIADVGQDDDGEVYQRIFRSIRDNYGLPQRNKRLYKQQFWLESEPSGEVTVKLRKGDNNNFEADEKTISLVNAGKDKVKQDVTWDKNDQNFQVQIEAENFFALLGYINKLFPKKGTF